MGESDLGGTGLLSGSHATIARQISMLLYARTSNNSPIITRTIHLGAKAVVQTVSAPGIRYCPIALISRILLQDLGE